MIDRIRPFGGFDYVQTENPTIDVNPKELGVTWCNMATGELFVCINANINDNQWVGQHGTKINTIDPYTLPSATTLFNFEAPASATTGITVIDGNLISTDTTTSLIYHHTGLSVAVQDSFSAPDSFMTGLGNIDGNLISCGVTEDDIFIHAGISSSISSTYSRGGNPRALTQVNGDIVYASSNTIYVMDGIINSVRYSFSSPSNYCYGLTFDGTNLISCDINTDLIYVHDGVTDQIITSFASPAVDPRGLAHDGTHLISSCSNRFYVHKNENEL